MPAEISANTTKYSLYGIIVTMAFNANSGSVSETSKHDVYNTKYSELSTPTRSYYTFDEWYTTASGRSKVTSTSDHTPYAHWIGIKLTVTFNANGGDSVSQTSKTVNYDSTYETLPTATRTGYTFVGWFSEGNENVTNETSVRIARDHTFYAQWTENITQIDSSSYIIEIPTNKVEIISSTKDLSKEDIVAIINNTQITIQSLLALSTLRM